jgi:cell division protein FtsB
MKQKLEHYLQLIGVYLNRLSDPRFVGQVVFVIIVLLVSWSGIKSIQTNYTLQKQIGSLKQQNNVQALKNDNAKLQNNYYNSNQFLELSARQNFGLAAPGEKEVVVPASIAETYVSDIPKQPDSQVIASKPLLRTPNFQAWVNFFLHRSPN